MEKLVQFDDRISTQSDQKVLKKSHHFMPELNIHITRSNSKHLVIHLKLINSASY